MEQTTTTGDRELTDLLHAQHREVKRLFAELGRPEAEIVDRFCELRRLLAVHETAEEEIVYPVLRRLGPEGAEAADARVAEESAAKNLLAGLESTEPGSREFVDALEELRRAVLAHADAEEATVFPLLRDAEPTERLVRMGKLLQIAEAAAPAHPHPHGPDSALGNFAVGPFIAIADRVRDAIGASRSA